MKNNIMATMFATLIVIFGVSAIFAPIIYGIVAYTTMTLTNTLLSLIAIGVVGILLGVLSRW